jgi:hypothetical protein
MYRGTTGIWTQVDAFTPALISNQARLAKLRHRSIFVVKCFIFVVLTDGLEPTLYGF